MYAHTFEFKFSGNNLEAQSEKNFILPRGYTINNISLNQQYLIMSGEMFIQASQSTATRTDRRLSKGLLIYKFGQKGNKLYSFIDHLEIGCGLEAKNSLYLINRKEQEHVLNYLDDLYQLQSIKIKEPGLTVLKTEKLDKTILKNFKLNINDVKTIILSDALKIEVGSTLKKWIFVGFGIIVCALICWLISLRKSRAIENMSADDSKNYTSLSDMTFESSRGDGYNSVSVSDQKKDA